jgi:hypothetical protein
LGVALALSAGFDVDLGADLGAAAFPGFASCLFSCFAAALEALGADLLGMRESLLQQVQDREQNAHRDERPEFP